MMIMITTKIMDLFSLQTEVGIVYNVIQNKMYTAKKGKGAFCNDTRIHVNPVNGEAISLNVVPLVGCKNPFSNI